jgi:hypothetical protein
MAAAQAPRYYVRVDAYYLDPAFRAWIQHFNGGSPDLHMGPNFRDGGGSPGQGAQKVSAGLKAAVKMIREEIIPKAQLDGVSPQGITALQNLANTLEIIENVSNLAPIEAASAWKDVMAAIAAVRSLVSSYPAVAILVGGIAVVALAGALAFYTSHSIRVFRRCGWTGIRRMLRFAAGIRGGLNPDSVNLNDLISEAQYIGNCLQGSDQSGSLPTDDQMSQADLDETGSTDGWQADWNDTRGDFPTEEPTEPCGQCNQLPCECFPYNN